MNGVEVYFSKIKFPEQSTENNLIETFQLTDFENMKIDQKDKIITS